MSSSSYNFLLILFPLLIDIRDIAVFHPSIHPSIHPTVRRKNRPLSPVSTPLRRVPNNFFPHPYLQIKFSPPMIEDSSNPIPRFSTDRPLKTTIESGRFTFLRKREENLKNFIEKIDTRNRSVESDENKGRGEELGRIDNLFVDGAFKREEREGDGRGRAEKRDRGRI